MLRRYETVLVPELNMGQLLLLLRGQFPGMNFVGLNKVQGIPFPGARRAGEDPVLLAVQPKSVT